MTLENLNSHLGVETKHIVKKDDEPKNKSKESFIDFIRDQLATEGTRNSTKRQKLVAFDALVRWGKIKTFEDLTHTKLKLWDEWLHEESTRTDACVYNYHKRIKPYVRMAYEKGIIDKDNDEARITIKENHSARPNSRETKWSYIDVMKCTNTIESERAVQVSFSRYTVG